MSEKVPQYDVIVEPCRKQGLKTLKLIKEGREIYLSSKYDPVSEAERAVAGLTLNVDSVYIIFGLGTGCHAKALLKRMGDDNRLVVFEPVEKVYELFMKAGENKELLNDSRIAVLKYESVYMARKALEPYYETPVSFRRNYLFIHPVYRDAYVEQCRDFALCIKSKILGCVLEKNTNKLMSKAWFNCILSNMSFLRRSWSGQALADLYRGVPAVIVSAGPSLSKNSMLLKELSGKAVLISVDTAYIHLYNNGITPDLVVSVDAQPVVFRKFRNSDISEKDLLTTYISSAKVQKKHTGRIIGIRDFHVFLDRCYDDLGINLLMLETGGSVACTALDAAYKMGADPIIFVGQDLAYTGNVSHIKDTPFYIEGERVTNSKTVEVEGIDGGKLLTSYTLDSYRQWIEMFIGINGDRTYIDATEGGAKINGAEIMTLREAIDNSCNTVYNIAERKETVFIPSNKTTTKEQYIRFVEDIENSGKYLKRIVKDIDICIRLTDKMIKEIGTNGFKRPEKIAAPYKKIKKLNKSLDDNEHYVDIILPLVANERNEASRSDHLLNGHITKEQALIIDLSKFLTYYEALSKQIKYAVPVIEEAVRIEKDSLGG